MMQTSKETFSGILSTLQVSLSWLLYSWSYGGVGGGGGGGIPRSLVVED